MKFDLNTEVFDKKSMKALQAVSPNQAVEPMPLFRILVQLLLAGADKQQNAELKAKNYQLLTKILAVSETESSIIDLSLSDITVLKGLADANCPTLVHGRLIEILEAPIA